MDSNYSRRDFLSTGSKVIASLVTAGTLPTSLSSCGKRDKQKPEQELDYMKLQGIDFGERYMPASGSSFNAQDIRSRYSFSMDTELGRKAVQVHPYRKYKGRKLSRVITVESIDALIEPGTKVEIQIEKDKVDQQVYTVRADKIKVEPAQTK